MSVAISAPTSPPAAPPLEGSQRVAGTLALSLATFMTVLDSSIANVSLPAIAGDMGASPSPEGSMSQLSTAAVLTVLNAAPAADAFRPPYAGNDKTVLYRESQIDYSVLVSLSPGTGAPMFSMMT